MSQKQGNDQEMTAIFGGKGQAGKESGKKIILDSALFINLENIIIAKIQKKDHGRVRNKIMGNLVMFG